MSEELIFHYKARCFYVTKCDSVVSVYSSSLSIKNLYPLRNFSFLLFIPLIPMLQDSRVPYSHCDWCDRYPPCRTAKLLHQVPIWSPLRWPLLYNAFVTIVIFPKQGSHHETSQFKMLTATLFFQIKYSYIHQTLTHFTWSPSLLSKISKFSMWNYHISMYICSLQLNFLSPNEILW